MKASCHIQRVRVRVRASAAPCRLARAATSGQAAVELLPQLALECTAFVQVRRRRVHAAWYASSQAPRNKIAELQPVENILPASDWADDGDERWPGGRGRGCTMKPTTNRT
jgi:hypothetical protein